MNLKEFVSQAISDVLGGVAEAQKGPIKVPQIAGT
jgi:hypothetical protein